MKPACLLVPLLLFGCSTYQTRRACYETDWTAYGKKAAQNGQHLEGDSEIKACRESGGVVDQGALDRGYREGVTLYCEPDHVFNLGKRGEIFETDLCEKSDSLKAKYGSGLREFCQEANGFPVGASGHTYSGVCPKDLEIRFLKEYRRGRRNYIQATVASNESALRELEVSSVNSKPANSASLRSLRAFRLRRPIRARTSCPARAEFRIHKRRAKTRSCKRAAVTCSCRCKTSTPTSSARASAKSRSRK